jgi:hypothetical protein
VRVREVLYQGTTSFVLQAAKKYMSFSP